MKKFLGLVIVLAIAGGALYWFKPELFTELPNERMGEIAVSKHIAEQTQDLRLALFKKTDGQESEVAGVKRYTLEYSAALEAKKDVMWSFSAGRFETTEPLSEDASRRDRRDAEERLAGKQLAKRGETTLVTGAVDYERKESGWVVTRVTLSLDR